MSAPLTPEELHALRGLDACTLANAIETFHERLRNEGFVDHTVRCLFPELPPMLGYAATLRIRGSAPPTADGVYQDRTGLVGLCSHAARAASRGDSGHGRAAWLGLPSSPRL